MGVLNEKRCKTFFVRTLNTRIIIIKGSSALSYFLSYSARIFYDTFFPVWWSFRHGAPSSFGFQETFDDRLRKHDCCYY